MMEIDVAYSGFETKNVVVFVDLQSSFLAVQLIENISNRMRYKVYNNLLLVKYRDIIVCQTVRFMSSWTSSPFRARFSTTTLTMMFIAIILLLFVTIVLLCR
jgi:hypothetical protein